MKLQIHPLNIKIISLNWGNRDIIVFWMNSRNLRHYNSFMEI